MNHPLSLSQANRQHKAAHKALSEVLGAVQEDDPELFDLIMRERETARAVEAAHRLRYRLLSTRDDCHYFEEEK